MKMIETLKEQIKILQEEYDKLSELESFKKGYTVTKEILDYISDLIRAKRQQILLLK